MYFGAGNLEHDQCYKEVNLSDTGKYSSKLSKNEINHLHIGTNLF